MSRPDSTNCLFCSVFAGNRTDSGLFDRRHLLIPIHVLTVHPHAYARPQGQTAGLQHRRPKRTHELSEMKPRTLQSVVSVAVLWVLLDGPSGWRKGPPGIDVPL